MAWRMPLLLRQVAGSSMEPAYKPGQLVIALCWWRTLRPGDVVIVRHAGREKLKRITCMQADSVWLEGDNSQASTDSRQFGALPLSSVVAKVMAVR